MDDKGRELFLDYHGHEVSSRGQSTAALGDSGSAPGSAITPRLSSATTVLPIWDAPMHMRPPNSRRYTVVFQSGWTGDIELNRQT